MEDPQTNEEWQQAVNDARFLLLLDSAKQYGLVETDIEVNVDRCDEILEEGRGLGFLPDPDDLLIERQVLSRTME